MDLYYPCRFLQLIVLKLQNCHNGKSLNEKRIHAANFLNWKTSCEITIFPHPLFEVMGNVFRTQSISYKKTNPSNCFQLNAYKLFRSFWMSILWNLIKTNPFLSIDIRVAPLWPNCNESLLWIATYASSSHRRRTKITEKHCFDSGLKLWACRKTTDRLPRYNIDQVTDQVC